MKKLFAGIFATVLGLSTLTACDGFSLENLPFLDKTDYNVEGAAEFLDATYIDQIVDGRNDYDLPNTISYLGVSYSVEWSVDVTTGVTLVKGNKTTKVDVDEASTTDVDYTLTATLKAKNGDTATVVFYATLLKAKALIPVEITAKPVEGTAYKLYVYNNDSKIDCYFNGKIKSDYYLGSVEDYEDETAVDVYVEYVEGSDTLFNLYFKAEVGGEMTNQYFGIRQNWNSKKGYWAYNPYIENDPVSQFEYSTEYNTIITTVPASSVEEEGAAIDTTKVVYWGNSGGTYTTIGGMKTSDFGKEGFVANLVTLESAANKTAEEKIAFEKDALQATTSYTGDATVELTTIGKRYPDVKIAWAVTGDCASYEDGTLTITAPSAETTVTLTATLTVGELTETKEFTITVKPAISVPAAGSTLTIPEALELGAKFEKDKYTEGKYYVTGVIKSVSNTQFGNLYIKDEAGNELYVYGLYDEAGNKYEAMDPQPKVGDTVTIYGAIGYYNSVQMKNATMTAYTAGETENDKEVGELTAVVPEAGKPYYFGMTQANLENKVYYLAGGMDGFYMATTDNANSAIETYLEETTGGYYFYTYVGDVKTYINMVVSGDHVNGAYEATASTVYTINAEKKTLIAIVNDTEYWFGTRNDKTYTTMGPCAVSYNGFYGVFYAEGVEGGEGEGGEVIVPTVTVADIATVIANQGKQYQTTGTVVGIYARGYIIKDGTGMILVYKPTTYEAKLGDNVTVVGTSGAFNGGAQFGEGCVVTVNEAGSVGARMAESLTGADCDALLALTTVDIKYVSITGTLNVSGSYYNVTMDGATTAVGSIAYPSEEIAAAAAELNGQEIVVEGYFFSISKASGSPKYINILATSVTAANAGTGDDKDDGKEDEECKHNYVDGECTECGEADPNYKPAEGEKPGDVTEKSYAYTLANGDVSYGTVTLGGVEWTFTGNSTYIGWDNQTSARGVQLGKGSEAHTTLTVTSESLSNVSKVTVNVCGAKDVKGTCEVYVGDTLVGTITLTNTATDYSFDVAGLTGEIKLVYTQTSSKAFYLKSIAVEYAE